MREITGNQKRVLIRRFLADESRENALNLEAHQDKKHKQQKAYQQALQQYLQDLERARSETFSEQSDDEWARTKATLLKSFKRQYFDQ